MMEPSDFRWSLAFFELLARYAETRDASTRRRLAVVLAHSDFEDASMGGCLWLAVTPILAIILLAQWRSLWILLVWLAATPLIFGMDAFLRRQAASRSLERGACEAWTKTHVGEIADGIFASYWTREGHAGEFALHHPDSLRTAIDTADEVWFWRLPLPTRNNLRVRWNIATWAIGLVRRVHGRAELVVGSETFYDYDPWTGRILR